MNVPVVVFDLNKTGCAIARCLGRRGVPVTGVHTVPYPALGARSRYVRDPLFVRSGDGDTAMSDMRHDSEHGRIGGARDAGVLAALDMIAARSAEKPVVLCATDSAVDFCSRNRVRLQERFRLPDAGAIPLHELLDKGVQSEVAARAGLSVPRSAIVRRETHDIAGALAAIPLPVIVKPGNSLFGYKRLMGIEHTRDGLIARVAATLAECPYVIVSAYVPGAAPSNYTVMVLGRRDGEPVVAAVTRKLRQVPRLAFGAGTLVERCRDDELAALACAFVREAGVTGPVEIEFKRENGRGRAWFIEANLRCSALVEMTAAAGTNLPYLAYLDALHDTESVPAARTRARVLWVDELRDWTLCANGEIALDELLRGYAGVTMLSLHAADDPEPFEMARREAMDEAGEHRPLLTMVLDRLLAAKAVTA